MFEKIDITTEELATIENSIGYQKWLKERTERLERELTREQESYIAAFTRIEKEYNDKIASLYADHETQNERLNTDFQRSREATLDNAVCYLRNHGKVRGSYFP